MKDKSQIMSTPEPWRLVAQGYAETTMQMLAQYVETVAEITMLKFTMIESDGLTKEKLAFGIKP